MGSNKREEEFYEQGRSETALQKLMNISLLSGRVE